MHLGNCVAENNSILENDRFRESFRKCRRMQRINNLRFSKTFLETIFSKLHPGDEF